MILQRLAEHYDRLEASGTVKLAKPGFSQQKISFCIVLEPDGRLNSIEDMRRQDGKTLQPRTMIVPGQGKPSGSGLNPCFLWDNASYMLGWHEEAALLADVTQTEEQEKWVVNDTEWYSAHGKIPKKVYRSLLSFKEFRKKHCDFELQIDHPSFRAVCTFLKAWSPEDVLQLEKQLGEIASNFGIFRIAGEHSYVHQDVMIPKQLVGAEETEIDESVGEETAICLITGMAEKIARLHEPALKGVIGAQSSGAKLVSFNEAAFTSYGKDQSYNAPVSTVAVFKYANALNHLLTQRERRIGLGDATVVFWADHAEPLLEDCLAELFGGMPVLAGDEAPQEDQQRVDEARRLLTQMRDGTRNAPLEPDGQPTKFYILGLSPNASRLSIRLWIEAEAPELERRLSEHLRDLALKTNFEERPLSIRLLANATGRYDAKGKTKFDTKGVSPQLVGELARAVLTGTAYPQSFLATMVRRIRSDAYVGYERVSAIKACLVRNSRLRGAPLEVPVELDIERGDVAYRCGCLFALLEKAQTDSVDGELNSTIKDKYFAAASATPALVFPRLFRLNNHHLAKLETSGKVFYSRRISAAMQAPFAFPKSLDLSEQGQFIVGYFQQLQDLYKKKNKAPEEEA